MRYAFIKMHQKAWPITLMCRVLEVSKTGYYDWGKRCPWRQHPIEALDEHIREVFNQHTVMVHRASPMS